MQFWHETLQTIPLNWAENGKKAICYLKKSIQYIIYQKY